MSEAFELAVKLLAQREHSAAELRTKLKRRGFEAADIDEAQANCLRLHLQSDQRFAALYCQGRIERGYGPLVIRQLLRQQGIASEIIEAVLSAANEAHHWPDMVAKVWKKKFNRSNLAVSHAKQWQFLRYRGFTDESIKAFFDNQMVLNNENDE